MKEEEEKAQLQRSVLITPFTWSDGASRAQAKMNAALEQQFLEIFQTSKDGAADVGLNKLWLQVRGLCERATSQLHLHIF